MFIDDVILCGCCLSCPRAPGTGPRINLAFSSALLLSLKFYKSSRPLFFLPNSLESIMHCFHRKLRRYRTPPH
jgi:hypothetical protein